MGVSLGGGVVGVWFGTGDRGRGQGVSIRGHCRDCICSGRPLPPQTLGDIKHAFPPFLLLWEKKTNIAAILLWRKRLIKHSIASSGDSFSHVAGRTKRRLSIA